jgi:translation elongation factor EF-1beta
MAAAAATAKENNKTKGARSLIVLEVKPFDAETDLRALAKGIKEFEHEGIQNWGAEHKFEEIAYGIQKLIISLVVFDDLMGVDDITDLINSKYEDDVQSIDVAAMSKV